MLVGWLDSLVALEVVIGCFVSLEWGLTTICNELERLVNRPVLKMLKSIYGFLFQGTLINEDRTY